MSLQSTRFAAKRRSPHITTFRLAAARQESQIFRKKGIAPLPRAIRVFDRCTSEASSRLKVFLYACHPRLVKRYTRGLRCVRLAGWAIIGLGLPRRCVMSYRGMMRGASLMAVLMMIAAVPRGAHAGPGEAGGGRRSPGRRPNRADFVVLIWYRRD